MKTTVAFVSLGCDKNLVDSENMLGILNKEGFEIISNESKAEVLILNSCCFIEDAKTESIENILELAQYKETGNCKLLIVTGCMAERYKNELLDAIPEIDALLGTTSYDQIAAIIHEAFDEKPEKTTFFRDIDYTIKDSPERILTTPGYYGFLKISEGCNNHCTYCIIPKLRGRYRSKSIETLIIEAQTLVDQGVKEIILVAQDTTRYGIDLYKKKMLPTLLSKLSEITELKWIRLLYCYPEEITTELIETIKNEPKVCNYIDMPIQHADDNILKDMARRSSRAQLESVIKELRHSIPDITIRTTLIVGFPGETDKQFENLLDFVQKMRFDRLGVFTYSKEEDTPAALYENQIPDKIKKMRQNTIMETQLEISHEINKSLIGKTLEVIIGGKLVEEDVYVSRSYRDAPDVDGQVFIEYPGKLISGDMVSVTITKANEYDLIGEINNEYS